MEFDSFPMRNRLSTPRRFVLANRVFVCRLAPIPNYETESSYHSQQGLVQSLANSPAESFRRDYLKLDLKLGLIDLHHRRQIPYQL